MKKLKVTKIYRGLIIKALSGNLNEEERIVLDNWLEESGENKEEFLREKKIWENSLFYKNADMPDIEAEWTKLDNRIFSTTNAEIKSKPAIKRQITVFKLKPLLTAAVVILLLTAAVYVWHILSYSPEIRSASTVKNEQMLIKLPDGSEAVLNGVSSVSYPVSFEGDTREVKLKGEAFFTVVKDKEPFIVVTKNAVTTVLGTKFDVWSRGDETKVIVKEGIVKVTPGKDNKKSVRLTKNQSSEVIGNREPTEPKDVNAGFLLGWVEGKIVFEKTPLPDVTARLESFFDVPVSIDGEKLKRLTLTGSFKNMSIDSVLSVICLALDLKYANKNGQYIIEAK